MRKPQNDSNNDEIFMVCEYPKEMKALEEQLREKLDSVSMENVEDIVLMAYKSGYIDGWKQALFFAEK